MASKLNTSASQILAILMVSLFPAVQILAAENTMSDAASELIASLNSEQTSAATFSLNTDEHLRWHFVPDEIFARNGLPLGAMTDDQQQLARQLLQTGLSQRGYLTASAIIELERVLAVLEPNGRFRRDNENYRVSIFGEPSASGTWAWRFEGHHLSLHFQIVAGDLTVSTPSFFGSNPAHVTEAAQTPEQENQRVLGAREDAGRALVSSMSEAQKAQAVLPGAAPRDIATGASFPIDPLTPAGIQASELTSAQLQALRDLISVYSSAMTEEIARKRWARIEADGIEAVSFAWAGPLEVGEPHYYRVQGPSFLIEYDNVQNGANHVHSVWRDFDGDFGEDLLRQHHGEFTH